MFKVHVSCSPSYEIPRVTCADSFFGCGPGGNQIGGGGGRGPEWRFLTLSSQFPGQGQPPPPVLN